MIDSNSPLAQGRLPRCLRRFERLTACVLHFEADPGIGSAVHGGGKLRVVVRDAMML